MNANRLLAVALAALLASAGAAGVTAASTTGTSVDAVDEPAYDASATYENGTVTFAVTENGSGVQGLNVSVDGELVGTTDANGTVAFATNESEFTVVVTGENVTGEFTYALENGTLTRLEGEWTIAGDENADEEDETDGPPTDMPSVVPDHVVEIHKVIQLFLDGELDENTTLGEAVSAVASGNAAAEQFRGPDHAGPPSHAGPHDDEDDGDEESSHGPPEDAGPPDDRGPDDDDDDDDDEEADGDDQDGDDENDDDDGDA